MPLSRVLKTELTIIAREILTFLEENKRLKGGRNPENLVAATIYAADNIIAKIHQHLGSKH
ncbi:MAG: hypothetical protein BAJALOKI2v1_600001, partial [Promethearchaeota archaeon]